VFEFKGNTILCQAIVKILGMRKNSKLSEIPPCSLEIDYRGIKLVNHAQDNEVSYSLLSLSSTTVVGSEIISCSLPFANDVIKMIFSVF
jgi:hypothetical protein